MKRIWMLALCVLCFPMIDVCAQQKTPPKAPQPEFKIPANIILEADIEYGRAGDRSLKLDVLRPRNQGDKMLPVVVAIHGGAWRMGSKDAEYPPLSELVVTGNYVGVTVGYRLTKEAIWPAQIHDCKAAIRWIRANAAKYHIDPDRIGLRGSSAGGHLVAMLGTTGDLPELEGDCGNPGYSTRVRCVVSICGAHDFIHFFEEAQGKDNSANARRAVSFLLGGAPDEKPEVARAASPVTYVSSDDPPFLLAHGTIDQSVPFEQSVTIAAALQKAGVPVTFLRMLGGGHTFGGEQFKERRRDFFEKHLRGKAIEISAAPIDVSAAPTVAPAKPADGNGPATRAPGKESSATQAPVGEPRKSTYTYKKVDGLDLQADVFRPADDRVRPS